MTSCRLLEPVARTPSTGPGSIASTASANSLASTPVVPTNKAITPANGPRPTATTNSMAKTISLMERKASITRRRSEEHTSKLQSLMRISYAVFCLKKKNYHIAKYQEQKEEQTALNHTTDAHN